LGDVSFVVETLDGLSGEIVGWRVWTYNGFARSIIAEAMMERAG